MNNLRLRLVLWTVAMEAVLLLFFSIVLLVFIQQRETGQIEDILRLSAAELNAVVDIQGSQYIVSPQETTDLRTRGVMTWVIAPGGQVGFTVGNAEIYPLPQPIPPLEEMRSGELSNGTPVYLFNTTLTEGSRQLGTMVLAFPLAESRRFIDHILLALGIGIPLILLLSIGGGLFLANRALSPVAVITKTTQQISNADDLSRRLDLDLPDDEIGRLAHTFNGMLDRLELAFQHERQFTADASHELRTPLGFLKTQLSLARSRPRNADTLQRMMADMEEDIDRMTRLIEQMLALARVEQGDALLHDEVDLAQLLRQLVQEFQTQAQESSITLSLRCPAQVDMRLAGNAEQLRRVFSNLIENGLKYTPEGGFVKIELARHWQQITVTVSDNGIGIQPEALPHLFERFYRVDDARARKTGGFGLGLAITRAIVQAHHGQITVTSTPGSGTTFTVQFPVSRLPSQA